MPGIVAGLKAVVGFVGGLAASGGVTGFLVKGALHLAGAYVLNAVAQSLQKRPDWGDFQSEATSRLVSSKASGQPRRIVYGEMRVAGQLAYVETHGDDNKYIDMIWCLAGHECESIEEIWLDDDVLTFSGSDGDATNSKFQHPEGYGPLVLARKHLGTSTQTADGDLDGVSSNWTSAHRLRGICYIMLRLHYNEERMNRIPNVTAVVQGKNDIYDPRDLSTGYSNNAALCIANYMSDTAIGLGIDYSDLDDTTLQASANECDESVNLNPSGTESRYTLNGSFLSSVEPRQILEKMLTAMAGKLANPDDKWYIYAGSYTAPTVTLTDTNLRAGFEVQTKPSRRENFNAVRGLYANPDANYQPDDFPPVTNSTYETEDNGERVWMDIELPFTTSSATAQRLAKIELEDHRQSLLVNYPATMAGWQVQEGDTVAITNSRMGWSSKVFEVLEATLVIDQAGAFGVDLLLKETASTIYDWNSGEETTVDPAPNTNLPDPSSVEPPTSLTVTSGTSELVTKSDGSIISRAKLMWTRPIGEFALRIQPEYKPSVEVTDGAITSGTTTLTSASNPFTAAMVGKAITIPGAGVAGADLSTTIDSFTDEGEVEVADAASTTVTLKSLSGACFWRKLPQIPVQETRLWIPDLVDGTDYDFRVASVSGTGVLSSYATVTGHTLVGKTEVPATLTGLSLTAQDHSLLVEWTDSTEADRSRVWLQYDTSASFTDDPVIRSFDWESPAVIPNLRAGLTYYVRAKHVDTSGNVSASWSSSASAAPLFTQKEIPDFAAYGYIGGSSDFTYKLNYDVTDSAETGTLLIKGNKFISPTDEAVYAKAALYEVDFPNLFPGTGPTPYYLVHLLDDVATDVYPAGTFSTNTTNNIVPVLYGYHVASNTWKWYIVDVTGASSELTSGQGYILFARVMVAADGSGDVLEVEPIASQVEKPIAQELEFDTLADVKAYAAASAAAVPNNTKFRWKGRTTVTDGHGGAGIWDNTSTDTADDLSTIKLTAVSTGRIKRTFNYSIQAEQAGAVGDGTTDDTAAIQAILDLNMICLLGRGQYRITSPLNLKRASGIIGRAWSIYPDTAQTGQTWDGSQESVLLYDPSSPGDDDAMLFASAEAVGTEVTSSFDNTFYGVVLRDFILDGNNKAAFGLYAVRPYEWDVYNVCATNTLRHGGFVNGAYAGSFTKLYAFVNQGRGWTFGGGDLFYGWSNNYQANGLTIQDVHCAANGRNKLYDDDDDTTATAWVTSTSYSVGDRRSNGGFVYVCLTAHTSGTFSTDYAAGKWAFDDRRFEGYGLGLFMHRGNQIGGLVSENNDGVGILESPSSGPNFYSDGYLELNNYFVPNARDGAISASDSTLVCATERPFNVGMVGKNITVAGAGVSGADLTTTIASFTDVDEVELADAASTTVSSATVTLGDDAVTESRAAQGIGFFFFGRSGGVSLHQKNLNFFMQGGSSAQGIYLGGTEPSSGREEGGVELEQFYPSASASGSFDPLIADWDNYRLINCSAEIMAGISGSSPAGHIELRGGLSFGNEALNYYDEGSWTPVIEGTGTAGTQTYSVQVGRYTRIGNTVFFHGRIVMTALDGATAGPIRITGLPFTSSNVGNLFHAVTVADFTNMSTAVGALSGRIDYNTAYVLVFKHEGLSTSAQVAPSDLSNTSRITVSGFYQTG